MKKQIWMRPDQTELTIECLRFARVKLTDDIAHGAHKFISGPFTYRRIGEILELLGYEGDIQ